MVPFIGPLCIWCQLSTFDDCETITSSMYKFVFSASGFIFTFRAQSSTINLTAQKPQACAQRERNKGLYTADRMLERKEPQVNSPATNPSHMKSCVRGNVLNLGGFLRLLRFRAVLHACVQCRVFVYVCFGFVEHQPLHTCLCTRAMSCGGQSRVACSKGLASEWCLTDSLEYDALMLCQYARAFGLH